MPDHIDDLLPFYLNRSLDPEEETRVAAHLKICPRCQAHMAEWATLAEAVESGTGMQHLHVPALSPLVFSSQLRRPPLHQAILSSVKLIWAQRMFLTAGWLFPLLAGFLLVGFSLAFFLQQIAVEWAAFPLLAAIPMFAALITAFLYSVDEDAAAEIVAAAPISAETLVMARLTLALAGISLFAFTGCVLLMVFSGLPVSIFQLSAAWLGPMLVLSALTTVLSLALNPHAAVGIVLALWIGILLLILSEGLGRPVVEISFTWLLHPNITGFTIQIVLAAILWLTSLHWLAGGGATSWRFSGGE